jgi:hypothetical protein
VKMREWDSLGLAPAFGHQGEWLANLLDRAASPEIAAYAVLDGRSARSAEGVVPSEQPRRFVVVSQLGLLDGRYVPDARQPRRSRLVTALVPWSSVHGLELLSETTLDEAFRHRTTWHFRLAQPAIDVAEPVSDAALIDLWRECLLRAATPPDQKPSEPD